MKTTDMCETKPKTKPGTWFRSPFTTPGQQTVVKCDLNRAFVSLGLVMLIRFILHGIVGFNVPLDTLQVVSETILRVR